MLATFVVVSLVLSMVISTLMPWIVANIKTGYEHLKLVYMLDDLPQRSVHHHHHHHQQQQQQQQQQQRPPFGRQGSAGFQQEARAWHLLNEDSAFETAQAHEASQAHQHASSTRAPHAPNGRATSTGLVARMRPIARVCRAVLCSCCLSRDTVPPMSKYEKEAKRSKFDATTGLSGVIQKYMSLLIQIGYIVLFAPAFPIAALLAFFFNILRLRADAYLLLYNTQRPTFRCGQDIGSLQGALRMLTFLAVATHTGLLVFTSTQLHELLPFTVFGIDVTAHNKFATGVVLFVMLGALQSGLVLVLDVVLPVMPKTTSIWKAVEAKIKEMGKEAAAAEEKEALLREMQQPPPTLHTIHSGTSCNTMI